MVPRPFRSLQCDQAVLVAFGGVLSVHTTVWVATVRYGDSAIMVFTIFVAVNTAPGVSGGGGGMTLLSAFYILGQ